MGVSQNRLIRALLHRNPVWVEGDLLLPDCEIDNCTLRPDDFTCTLNTSILLANAHPLIKGYSPHRYTGAVKHNISTLAISQIEHDFIQVLIDRIHDTCGTKLPRKVLS